MIQAQTRWEIDPGVRINSLSKNIKNKAMRIALNAAASPVKAAVIASAPVEHGVLQKSTGIKITNIKNGPTWVAVVGAKSSFKRLLRRNGKVVKRRTSDGKRAYARPSRYQKLVDQGGKHIRGRQYLSRALSMSSAQFQAIARLKLSQLLAQYLK